MNDDSDDENGSGGGMKNIVIIVTPPVFASLVLWGMGCHSPQPPGTIRGHCLRRCSTEKAWNTPWLQGRRYSATTAGSRRSRIPPRRAHDIFTAAWLKVS